MAKSKGKTWQEWWPEKESIPIDDLLTKEEMIEEFANRGVHIDPVTLRYWMRIGSFPHPIRWYRDGQVRGLWPKWLPDVATTEWIEPCPHCSGTGHVTRGFPRLER